MTHGELIIEALIEPSFRYAWRIEIWEDIAATHNAIVNGRYGYSSKASARAAAKRWAERLNISLDPTC